MALAECNCHDVIVIDSDRGVDFVRRQNSNAASLPEEEEALEVTRTGASVPTWTWVHGGRCAPPLPRAGVRRPAACSRGTRAGSAALTSPPSAPVLAPFAPSALEVR